MNYQTSSENGIILSWQRFRLQHQRQQPREVFWPYYAQCHRGILFRNAFFDKDIWHDSAGLDKHSIVGDPYNFVGRDIPGTLELLDDTLAPGGGTSVHVAGNIVRTNTEHQNQDIVHKIFDRTVRMVVGNTVVDNIRHFEYIRYRNFRIRFDKRHIVEGYTADRTVNIRSNIAHEQDS